MTASPARTGSNWLVEGGLVSVLHIDEHGREVVDLDTVVEVRPDGVTLRSGRVLHGEVDPDSSTLKLRTEARGESSWAGHRVALPAGPTPSQAFSTPWSSR